jgi:hypothetical protein
MNSLSSLADAARDKALKDSGLLEEMKRVRALVRAGRPQQAETDPVRAARHSEFGVHLEQQFHDASGRLRIERSHRFIRKQEARPLNQNPGNRCPLLLSAGQCGGSLKRLLGQANRFKSIECTYALSQRKTSEQGTPHREFRREASQDVGHDRQTTDQIKLVKNNSHLPSERADVPAVSTAFLKHATKGLDLS